MQCLLAAENFLHNHGGFSERFLILVYLKDSNAASHFNSLILGSLSTSVFETRTATGREHFECKDRIVSQIFILLISNGEN